MRAERCTTGLFLFVALAGCSGSSSPASFGGPALPGPSDNGTVPASVVAVAGYKVSVFAKSTTSTNPDSLAQIGQHIFVGYGDSVGPGGAPAPGGLSQVEVDEYDLSGHLQRTFEVPGHNDGLMAYDADTLWTMSNEDANAELITINVTSGQETVYKPQPSLVNGSGGLPHGGGLDDMQLINGKVYVSASNPTVSTTAACPATSSTPGCPNGVNNGPIVYILSLNGDGATFNLTPVVASGAVATNMVTHAITILNSTDADSESVSPDGSTLIVDSQQDAELVFLANLSGTPTVSYLPLTQGGAPQQVDDTRFAPAGQTFMLDADTPNDTVYRIDGAFGTGNAFSSAQTTISRLNPATGVLSPIVSGFGAPHGMIFVTPQ